MLVLLSHTKPNFSLKDTLSPSLNTGDTMSVDGVRFIHINGRVIYFVYELKPQIITIRYSNSKPRHSVFEPLNEYKIRIPHVFFCVFESSYYRSVQAFFSNKPFNSFNDKVCIACLPNIKSYGHLCWHLEKTEIYQPDIGLTVNQIMSQLSNPFNKDLDYLGTVFEYLWDSVLKVATKPNLSYKEIPLSCEEGIPFLHQETLKGTEIIWPEVKPIGSYLGSWHVHGFSPRRFDLAM